ncbi:MAG: hypothetical protein AB1298_02670 [Bacteroidota bacterium]
MKKLFIISFILISLTLTLAQEDGDVGWVARFGAAGGVNPAFVFPNLDPINSQIKKIGIDQLSNSGMFVLGGSGYIYIMLVENLRVGGMGIGGTKSTSGLVGGLNKEVKYNYGFGGVTVEYTLPFVKNIAVSFGAILGAGSSSIEIYQNAGSFTWEDTWRKVNNGIVLTNQVSDKISNTFFTIAPTVNIDIPLSRFIAFRIGGGYVAAISGDWKINNGQSIANIPSDLSINSFFIQTGIYFGLIAF